MSKIRVLHCLETIGSGGVEQRRLSLIRGLDSARYEQQIICTKAIGALPKKYTEAGCIIHEVGTLNNIFCIDPYKKTLDVIKNFKPHIIHGAVFEGVALAAVAGRLAHVPIIIGEETSDPQNRSIKGHILYRAITSLTNKMVAVSPSVGHYLSDKIKIPKSKVEVINNGVYEANCSNSNEILNLRNKYGLLEDHFVIGTVGRLLDSHKKISNIIKAFNNVIKVNKNARLIIIGSGPDEGLLRELVISENLQDQVIFTGYQGNTRPFYEIMDVFVLASAYEAFGLVLVEAMYASLPVIATRTGGIPKVVEEDVTALLVAPDSVSDLYESIIKLMSNKVLRQSMGQAGLYRARKNFSESRYITDIDNMYMNFMRSLN